MSTLIVSQHMHIAAFMRLLASFSSFFSNEALNLLREDINFLANTFNTPQETFQNCSGKEERKRKENGDNL